MLDKAAERTQRDFKFDGELGATVPFPGRHETPNYSKCTERKTVLGPYFDSLRTLKDRYGIESKADGAQTQRLGGIADVAFPSAYACGNPPAQKFGIASHIRSEIEYPLGRVRQETLDLLM